MAFEPKFGAEEMRQYYRRVHLKSISRQTDSLDPVIHPGESATVNRFTDYAQRLGMKRALGVVSSALGSLSGRDVLDLGCGRGRWCLEYANRGARVTGVDISPDAIRMLAIQMPDHRFICSDLAQLELPAASFDLANSVTVLQHLPGRSQEAAVAAVVRCLRPGGFFVALENTADFEAGHVFPRSARDWIKLVETAGMTKVSSRGCNFQPLLAWAHRLRSSASVADRREVGERNLSNGGAYRIARRVALAGIAAASFPVEWLCDRWAIARPTHEIMVFRKR